MFHSLSVNYAYTLFSFVYFQFSCGNQVGEYLGVSGMGAMRVFRTFRCLRPLRAMSRLQGLKVELWNKGILHDWWREGNENLLKSLAVSNCTVGWLWKWELQIKDLCTQCLFTRNIKLDKHLYIHKCLNELLVNLKWQWWVRMSVRWYGTAWALPIKGINLTEGGGGIPLLMAPLIFVHFE